MEPTQMVRRLADGPKCRANKPARQARPMWQASASAALHISHRGTEIDMVYMAADHQRGDRNDPGGFGFTDAAGVACKIDDVHIELGRIERLRQRLFGTEANRATGVIENSFGGHEESPLLDRQSVV